MIPEEILMNKNIWVAQIVRPIKDKNVVMIMRGLLNTLPARELRILVEYKYASSPDNAMYILERIEQICRYNEKEMIEHLQKDHSIHTACCGNGDLWAQLEKMKHLEAEWTTRDRKKGKGVVLPFAGWWLPKEAEEKDQFLPWARRLLLQEVRSNVWMLYLEHKEARVVRTSKEENRSYFGGNYI